MASALAGLGSIALALGSAAPAAPFDTPCPAPFQTLLANRVFSDFPAAIPRRPIKPAAPLVKTGEAHLYRTAIREAAKRGPDFAGHYTLAAIGCGAATLCVAIVDSLTGKVFFPPELNSAEALLVDTGVTNVDTLNYRPDSRLLIVVGTPNENPANEGLNYYLWRADKLRRVRFIPVTELCNRR